MKILLCFVSILIVILLISLCVEGQSQEWNPINNSVYTIRTGEFRGQEGRLFWGIRIEPDELHLGKISPTSQTNLAFHIDLVNAPSLSISNVQCSSPHFAFHTRTLTPGSSYVIEVTPKTPLPYGILRGRLLVATDKPWRPPLAVSIDATVTNGTIDVAPWELIVPYYVGIRALPRFVQIKSLDNREFSILRVVPPTDQVSVEKIWTRRDGARVIQLMIQPEKYLDGRYVQIITDSPSMPEILIPLRISTGRE
jgi:hypothetical protein